MKTVIFSTILLCFLLLFFSCESSGPEPPETLSFSSISTITFEDSCFINWNTNLPSKGVLNYGLTDSSLNFSQVDTNLFLLHHTFSLNNLISDTIYYFMIYAWSEDLQNTESDLDSFVTEFGDSLFILSLSVSPSSTQAIFNWSTSLPAQAKIFYSLSPIAPFDSLLSLNQYLLQHSDTLNYLAETSTYYYYISAWSQFGQTLQTALDSFITSGDSLLNIYDFTITSITSVSAVVRWFTDRLADGSIFYGSDSSALSDTLSDPQFIIEHQFTITDLLPETQYFARIISAESGLQSSDTLDTVFITPGQLKLSLPDTAITFGSILQYPVYIQNASNLTAVEYYIYYDPLILKAQEIAKGDFALETDCYFFQTGIDTINGILYNAVTWEITYSGNTPINTPADGSGALALIQFQTLAVDTSQITAPPDSVKFFDLYAQPLVNAIDNGQIIVLSP